MTCTFFTTKLTAKTVVETSQGGFMKKLVMSAFAIAAMGFLPMAHADQPLTKEVNITINEVYVPGGFSSETDAYVIVSGVFPNSCYRWGRSEVESPRANLYEVRSFANVTQAMCLMVLVPYSKEVRLGRLPAGEHTLRFVNGDGTYMERTVTVE
jgi:hypothetical protein